jgi:hypothetical protein
MAPDVWVLGADASSLNCPTDIGAMPEMKNELFGQAPCAIALSVSVIMSTGRLNSGRRQKCDPVLRIESYTFLITVLWRSRHSFESRKAVPVPSRSKRGFAQIICKDRDPQKLTPVASSAI